jgi:hypothetical protein
MVILFDSIPHATQRIIIKKLDWFEHTYPSKAPTIGGFEKSALAPILRFTKRGSLAQQGLRPARLKR